MTDLRFNDLSYLDDFIVRELEKNNNVSLSGLFKRHRKKVSMIGDYLILARILYISGMKGKKFASTQIWTALRYSSEYKEIQKAEKMSWLRDLLQQNKMGFEANK